MGSQTLILVRHGKAVSSMDGVDDFARNLTARGISDVRALGKTLLDKGLIPNYILSSPACRTAQTARLLALELGLDPDRDIVYEAALYLGGVRQVEEAIRIHKEKVTTLLYVGHNPEIGSLALHWSSGQGMQFPTAACIAFDWKGHEAAATLLYQTPR